MLISDWSSDVCSSDLWREFLSLTAGDRVILDLLGIAIAGGMFVVPLYAFLTTTVAKSQTARTVAANNIVNSGFMVAATLVLSLLIGLGLTRSEARRVGQAGVGTGRSW